MRRPRAAPAVLAAAALLVAGCSGRTDPAPLPPSTDLGPGVARSLAEHRSRTISDLSYDIHLRVPATLDEPLRGELTARFTLAASGSPLVLDFAAGESALHAVSVGGLPVDAAVRDEHIVLPAGALAPGPNEIAVSFTAGDGPLNRGADLLYTLFVPARARLALPVFDQPDLKARFRLTLELPRAWQAVSNGTQESRAETDGGTTIRFAETRPLPTYLFAFAAGRFEIATAERAGRTIRLFHRETDAAKVARNLEAIFDLHGVALEWLEDYTAIPYPFGKLDFVALPAFPYGGMEHAGAIFYRDRSLFLDESATQNQLLGRASLIAHEVAHMWFGDLVTMEWFDDVWTKEVFASLMAGKIVYPSFPEIDHELRFLLGHYPGAQDVDRTAGTHPIRQPLENLDDAGSLYGAIIYDKAPIAMKHLERATGEAAFRDGLRAYLDRHRYANASWPDLIAALDPHTPEDLAAWSRAWIEEAGLPTLRTTLEPDADGARVDRLTVAQEDPAGRGRLWPQPLAVVLGDADGSPSSRWPLRLREAALEVEGARDEPLPAFVLANGDGVGYGRVVLDDASLRFLVEHLPEVDDARQRAVAWLSLWEALLDGRVAPLELVELACASLTVEREELLVELFLHDLPTVYWRFLSADERSAVTARVEERLWEGLEAAPRPTSKGAYLAAYRDTALSADALERLRALLDGELAIDDLPLSVDDRTALAQALAVRGVADAEELLDRQRARISDPDDRARFDFVRPALSADPGIRDAFFASLADPSMREREPWVLEALGFLHHPLRAERAIRHILPSLELLPEIQATGDIFFPLDWLEATLGGHSSPEAAAIVRDFLASHPELPARLRGKVEQAADPLMRAVLSRAPRRPT